MRNTEAEVSRGRNREAMYVDARSPLFTYDCNFTCPYNRVSIAFLLYFVRSYIRLLLLYPYDRSTHRVVWSTVNEKRTNEPTSQNPTCILLAIRARGEEEEKYKKITEISNSVSSLWKIEQFTTRLHFFFFVIFFFFFLLYHFTLFTFSYFCYWTNKQKYVDSEIHSIFIFHSFLIIVWLVIIHIYLF